MKEKDKNLQNKPDNSKKEVKGKGSAFNEKTPVRQGNSSQEGKSTPAKNKTEPLSPDSDYPEEGNPL